MSYILDALRKSESERRQGRVPDLGQQIHLIHKPKKKSHAVAAWIGLGLVLNAAVLAYVFWPDPRSQAATTDAAEALPAVAEVREPEPESEPEPVLPDTQPSLAPMVQERPTIIVPSREPVRQASSAETANNSGARVPHLIEMPQGFQRSIPDLVFNSHIYASEPSSRRVTINNSYLRVGEVFSGIRVEQITEDGVVLSKDGRSFRVGVVRDWVSPK